MTTHNVTDTLGFLAAILTTGAFVPQAWLTFRTRDVSGISLAMYGAFTLGILLWLVFVAWVLLAPRAARPTSSDAGDAGDVSNTRVSDATR